ncbi:MAG: hypothetical protein RIR65_342 [Planctomycetota bacterium]|jgi:phosphodiesterase/alkaline phosphatase D-like protein
MLQARTLAAAALLGGIALAQSADLPQRVAAGDVGPNYAVLWARSATAGTVTFRYSTDPTLAGASTRTATVVDTTLPAKAYVRGLLPGTTYYYEAQSPTGGVDRGTFRTPRLGGGIQGLRFGVSGDSRGDFMPAGSLSNAATSNLDFFVMLGDTIYADVASPLVPVSQCTTLAEFRTKHAEVLSAFAGVNGVGDLRRSTALWVSIDDHEVTNDFAGGAAPASDARFDLNGTYINETNLFRNGMRSFTEYMPSLRLAYGQTGDARTAFKRKLYRKMAYGTDAALMVLDARSFRDQSLPAVANPNDPAQVFGFLAASYNPARTMLGRAQVDELKADLLAAEQAGIKWKFVMVPEPIQNLGVVAAQDRYEGYAAERTEVLAHVVANNIKNVVFVAADIHGTIVNNLTFASGPGQPQTESGAFEVTTGSICYNQPFGPTVVGLATALGLLTPQQIAFYQSLPLPGKDAFVQTLIDQQVSPLGYTTVGLAGAPISATLNAGGWSATHTFGWTEFQVAPGTGELSVTTWGVEPTATTLPPFIVSNFTVVPQ